MTEPKLPADPITTQSPPLEIATLNLEVSCQVIDKVTYSLIQLDEPIVRELQITNRGTEALTNIRIHLSMENGCIEPQLIRYDHLDPESTAASKPTVMVSAGKLASLTEAERTSLVIQVQSSTGEFTKKVPVELLPFDHWPGSAIYPELLAAYITPNHEKIAELLRLARPVLEAISGRDSFDGYQTKVRERAVHIAEACYRALHGLDLGYVEPPASFEQTGQRVRLVDRVLREKMGCCLDFSLLLASIWEQAGLNSLILIVEGHALPALWTHSSSLSDPAMDDPAQVRNLIKLGEIVPVESTLLASKGTSFADAIAVAERKLLDPGNYFCAVDVKCARKRGVKPLPIHNSAATTQLDLSLATDSVASPAAALYAVQTATRIESGKAQAAPEPKQPGSRRVAQWQARLLDLTLNNRLINFRHTTKTLQLAVPDLAAFEDGLASERSYLILSKASDDPQFLNEELRAGVIHTVQSATEAQSALLSLYREHRTLIDETGSNPLYAAIGMLKWYESEVSQLPRYAPILLVPVRISRSTQSAGYRYELSLGEEPCRVNITLLEKLKLEFGLDSPELGLLPDDERGIDVPLILHNFRTAIKHVKRWEVIESAHIGLFSFSKFLMWRDLQEHLPTLKQNRLVEHLLDRPGQTLPNPSFAAEETLDQDVPPQEVFCTRDADSSQLAAVRSAANGVTFVLEGPPGTGKSQTISNIIADGIARGKRILFVAEKKAALDVVSDRLNKDGLGQYCLELHSAKASKKEVLAQIERSITFTTSTPTENWQQLCTLLQNERAWLNTYVSELHRSRTSGETLYQVMGRVLKLGSGPTIAPSTQPLASTSVEQLAAWRHHLESAAGVAKAIDPPASHPLREVTRSAWSMRLREDAASAIENANAALHRLREALQSVLAVCHAPDAIDKCTQSDVQGLVTLTGLIDASRPAPLALTSAPAAKSTIARCRQYLQLAAQIVSDKQLLKQTYREELFSADLLVLLDTVKQAASKRGLFSFFTRRSARAKLRPYCINQVPTLDVAVTDLERALNLNRAIATAREMHAEKTILQYDFAVDTYSPAHAACVDRCEAIHGFGEKHAANPLLHSLIERVCMNIADSASLQTVAAALSKLVSTWQTWSKSQQTLITLLALSQSSQETSQNSTGMFKEVASQLERLKSGLHELKDWCAWRHQRDMCFTSGLDSLIVEYERGTLLRDQLGEAFERGYGNAWYAEVGDSVPAIRDFTIQNHQLHLDRFRKLDEQVTKHTSQEIAARLELTRPSLEATSSTQSELGILRKELQKKARHLPTRKLLELAPNLIARLKPCFLMSPLSVAQYLNAKLPQFDIVVFDEASQIAVWDSIGAIARGKEVIIVGDSKQLPPTNFFGITDFDQDSEPNYEDTASQDMESILQECVGSGVPRQWLKWHYRSRHESLIAFSNHHYYENRLHTFPSPQECSDHRGVTFHHVPDGIYDRAAARHNRIEALRVVSKVVELLTQTGKPDSIGIVTFNQAQQMLIEDMLDEKRRENPSIDQYFTSSCSEPVFVKNLENVQGDERDTIIFSIGYSRDNTGKLSMNFGPLNQSGGERRLNVAVTRARKRLMVFSGITSDQLDLKRTRATGVEHLKRYLDYAQRGPKAIAEAVSVPYGDAFGSSLESAVCESLRNNGWTVDTQVGCAGYRIDLAVKHPDFPGRYIIGIECDGASYHSAKTARDRDRLRESVLRSLGWRLTRVWSTDWWESPQRCIERLEAAIRAALSSTNQVPQSTIAHNSPIPVLSTQPDVPLHGQSAPVASLTTAPPASKQAARPEYPIYKPAPKPFKGSKDVYEETRTAVEALLHLALHEGPIVESLARERMATWFSLQRQTERYRNRFDELVTLAASTGQLKSADGVLCHTETPEGTLTSIRVPDPDDDHPRDITEIPLSELALAVGAIVKQQFSLPLSELPSQVGRLLGVQRVQTVAREHILNAIQRAAGEKRIKIDGDRATH